MKPPPFLISAGLLFWGLETGWIIAAVLMILLIEMLLLSRARWEFSNADLNRVWDLCAVLFIGALVIRNTSTDRSISAAYQFFQWFPLIFYPMILVQLVSNRDRIPLTVFSWFLRRRKTISERSATGLHAGFPYFALCLVSASASNRRDALFFAGLALLAGWALWSQRPKRFSAPVWLTCFAVTVVLAHYGHHGLHKVQTIVEGNIARWVSRWLHRGFDPSESQTGLGSIGLRKQSGQIVLRVQSESGRLNPLLRQASYDSFRERVWFASKRSFTDVQSESDTTTWQFKQDPSPTNALTVFVSLPRGRGTLPMPSGAATVSNLPVSTLATNELGAARVTQAPGLLGYTIHYQNHSTIDPPPDPAVDLSIHGQEIPVVQKIASDLRLSELEPAGRIDIVRQFLLSNFKYALYVPENLHRAGDSDTPLARFLTETRQGHCEYFASAAVLLLRAAGIPARYATGYAVQETAGSNRYIVRDRHAHAWALVWNNDQWEDFDATPGSWIQEEASQASAFEQLSDLWSSIQFQFLKWRWLSQRGWLQQAAPWLLAPLVLFLSWRLFVHRQRAKPTAASNDARALCPGLDSEFYDLERALVRQLGERPPGEPVSIWLRRLPMSSAISERTSPPWESRHPRGPGRWPIHPGHSPAGMPALPGPSANSETAALSLDELQSLLLLHYRYRFDPAGLTPAERDDLRAGVHRWIAHATA